MKQLIIAILLLIFCLCNQKLDAQPVAQLYRDAEIEYNSGNYSKALVIYNKLVYLDPKNIQSYKGRAFCFYMQNEYKKAISDFRIASGLPTTEMLEKPQIAKFEGLCYSYLQKWAYSIPFYDQYLDYFFDDVFVNIKKAEALFSLERYQEAIKTVNYLIAHNRQKKISDQDLTSLYTIAGYSYLFSDSLDQAKKYNQYAMKISPDDVDVARLSAEIYFWANNYNEAIQIYSKMLQKDSSLYYFKYYRAQAYYYQGSYGEAINDFRASKKFYLKSPELFYKLGHSEMELKNYGDAIKDLLVCIKLNPKSSTYFNQLSWTYFLMKKYEEALIYVNKALLLDPKNANAQDTRGCIYFKLSNYQKSIIDFNRAIQLDSASTNSYYYRALAFSKTNERPKALKDWEFLQKHRDYKEPEGEKTIEELMKK